MPEFLWKPEPKIDSTHLETHRCKAIPMQNMWDRIYSKGKCEDTHAAHSQTERMNQHFLMINGKLNQSEIQRKL